MRDAADMKMQATVRRGVGIRALLLACSALVVMGQAVPVLAQEAGQRATATLDIPAQPVASALVAFSRQTGIQVFVTSADAGDHRSTAISGPLAPPAALAQLLSGTGLTYDFTNEGTVTVSAPAEGAQLAATDGMIVLNTIYIHGADGTWGPVEGIVAERTGTGSKTDAAVIDIPASVSVVTTDEMRTRGVEDLDGALNYTSGVMTNLYGADERYDFFAIRGFDQTTSGAYRDGLQMRVYNLAGGRVEPYGMERIEVLKGSTSTLYGVNNPGGMVNMITKRPLDYKFGEVYATAGKDHLEAGADFGGPLDAAGNWTYRLTTKRQESTLPNGVSKDNRFYIAPALTWKPTARTSLTLMADYNEREGSNRYGIPLDSGIDPWTFLGEPDFEVNDTKEWNLGYAFEHDFGNGLVFRSHGRYSDLDLLSKNVYAAGNRHPNDGRLSWYVDGHMVRRSLDAHLQYDASFGRFVSRTLFGLDYTRGNTNEEIRSGEAGGVGDISNPIYCGTACITLRPNYKLLVDEETWGAYLQEELTFDDRWILTLGLRYDEIKANSVQDYGFFQFGSPTDETALTKRAGLTYRINSGLSVYGTYSESFTPVLPTYARMFSETKPMMGEMFELGAKWQPAGMNALFSAAAYDLTQTNVPYSTGNFTWEQIGKVRSRGVELEGKAALNERTNLTLAYSYTDAEIVRSEGGGYDGNRPMSIPEHMASLWLDHTLPGNAGRGDLTLGAGARLVGSRYADQANSFRLDSHTIFDAALRYQVAESTALSLNVENLFDREYVSHAETWSNPDTAFYGNPRTVKLTLRHTW